MDHTATRNPKHAYTYCVLQAEMSLKSARGFLLSVLPHFLLKAAVSIVGRCSRGIPDVSVRGSGVSDTSYLSSSSIVLFRSPDGRPLNLASTCRVRTSSYSKTGYAQE